MFDRFVNLLVVLVTALACWVLFAELVDSWYATPEWDRVWVKREGADTEHSAERYISAMQNAIEVGEFDDAGKIEDLLRQNYHPTGEIHTRLSVSELIGAASVFAIFLLPLMLPVSLNYVRHGKVRLWNPSNLKSEAESSE